MRRFLLALMIALLPLRGWVGDAMAMELTNSSTPAHQHAKASAPAAMANCHEGHADAAQPTAADTDHGGGDCASCTACQICHSVALTAMLPQLPAAVLPAAVPASSQPLYASAERALGDKPPIL